MPLFEQGQRVVTPEGRGGTISHYRPGHAVWVDWDHLHPAEGLRQVMVESPLFRNLHSHCAECGNPCQQSDYLCDFHRGLLD